MTHRERSATEDAEQLLATAAITLPYHPDTFTVLRGPHKGQDVDEAEISVARELNARFADQDVVIVRHTVCICPWWNWWLYTPARRLTPMQVQDWERE